MSAEQPSRAVCPGSFDPVTMGHLDIFRRASELFDEVIVAMGVNASKKRMFSDDERRDLLVRACADLPNVRIDGFEGLVTTYCEANGAGAIVKGLRAASDFDYELQMAQMNRHLTGVDTVFLPTDPDRSFLSSSLIKEVAALGGNVTGLVPDFVSEALYRRLKESN